MKRRLLFNIPLFVAAIAGIMAVYHLFYLVFFFFVVASILQERLIFREGG